MTFHDLRGGFLNMLRERGVSLDHAIRLSGHMSIAVVMDHYRTVPEGELAAVVADLGAENREAGGN